MTYSGAVTGYFNPRSPHGERLASSPNTRAPYTISTHAPRTGSDGGGGFGFSRRRDFNPRSPHGERRAAAPTEKQRALISTHAPRTGSDEYDALTDEQRSISTHAPRTGSDAFFAGCATSRGYFNPRSPHGERRLPGRVHPCRTAYFNPRSPHGERRRRIPAPTRRRYFNPRSPHGERPVVVGVDPFGGVFQPTLPARGATRRPYDPTKRGKFQPTLPARGATHPHRGGRPHGTFQPTLPARGATVPNQEGLRARKISTHAPRTGSDPRPGKASGTRTLFQPTLPARGATPRSTPAPAALRISTHAPRTGSDPGLHFAFRARTYFNPRSPHGERRDSSRKSCRNQAFQPTLPARGATRGGDERGGGMAFQPTLPARGATRWHFAAFCGTIRISTHAPRTGSDKYAKHFFSAKQHFNPRSPHGERQAGRKPMLQSSSISTHAPRTGSDGSVCSTVIF